MMRRRLMMMTTMRRMMRRMMIKKGAGGGGGGKEIPANEVDDGPPGSGTFTDVPPMLLLTVRHSPYSSFLQMPEVA